MLQIQIGITEENHTQRNWAWWHPPVKRPTCPLICSHRFSLWSFHHTTLPFVPASLLLTKNKTKQNKTKLQHPYRASYLWLMVWSNELSLCTLILNIKILTWKSSRGLVEGLHFLYKSELYRGCLGSSVSWASDFSSGHDLMVPEFEPRIGLCANSLESVSDSVSPSLSDLSLLMLCLCLSLSLKNK